MAMLASSSFAMNIGENWGGWDQGMKSSVSRAQVAAEAQKVSATRSLEPAGSRVMIPESKLNRADVRAQAAKAVKEGSISYGEM